VDDHVQPEVGIQRKNKFDFHTLFHVEHDVLRFDRACDLVYKSRGA
jgi:hypothetical protein